MCRCYLTLPRIDLRERQQPKEISSTFVDVDYAQKRLESCFDTSKVCRGVLLNQHQLCFELRARGLDVTDYLQTLGLRDEGVQIDG